MALKKTLTVADQFGGEHVITDAYIQVHSVAGGKLGLTFEYFIKKPDQVNVVDRRSGAFMPSMDDAAGNFLKQSYNHLKTLPEFAGAEDC